MMAISDSADGRIRRSMSAVGVVSSMCCVMPMMALSGVRISWLTLARNSPLARLASSDRARASSSRRDLSSSCRTRSRVRVTSWNVKVSPELPRVPSRAGCATQWNTRPVEGC